MSALPEEVIAQLAAYLNQHQASAAPSVPPTHGPLTDIQVLQKTLTEIELPNGAIGGPALTAICKGASAVVSSIAWQQVVTEIILEHERACPKVLAHIRAHSGSLPEAENPAAVEAVQMAGRALRNRLARPICINALEQERFNQKLPTRVSGDALNQMLASIGRKDLIPARKRDRDTRDK